MSAATPSSSMLLDEALWPLLRPRTVLLVEDCVETSGAFVLHHLIKRVLSSDDDTALVFLALAHPFSHYDRILRKLVIRSGGSRNEDGLIDLFGKIRKVVEVGAAQEHKRSITVIIDDVSLLEVAAHGSVDHVLDFLHYCHTLTSQLDCSLVMMNHDDIYSTMAAPRLISSMEYLADIVIKIEPLATGLAKDIHGQATVIDSAGRMCWIVGTALQLWVGDQLDGRQVMSEWPSTEVMKVPQIIIWLRWSEAAAEQFSLDKGTEEAILKHL
ncbi:hypothetical protein ACLOJK_001581 [Asimina triloba]